VCDRSPTFLFVALIEIIRFLELGKKMGENSMMGSFREWMRSQHAVIKVAQ
jgi:hypothetical protein